MKKIQLLFYLVTLVIFGIITKVNASHAVGADLTYTYVSANVIHLKLKFYRDCSGTYAPNAVNINISSVSCSTVPFGVSLPQTGFSEIAVSGCVGITSFTTCHVPPGYRYGVEEYIYEADVVLPAACSDWKLEFKECCRNNVNNIDISTYPYIYVSTILDNFNYPTNSSPQFLS